MEEREERRLQHKNLIPLLVSSTVNADANDATTSDLLESQQTSLIQWISCWWWFPWWEQGDWKVFCVNHHPSSVMFFRKKAFLFGSSILLIFCNNRPPSVPDTQNAYNSTFSIFYKFLRHDVFWICEGFKAKKFKGKMCTETCTYAYDCSGEKKNGNVHQPRRGGGDCCQGPKKSFLINSNERFLIISLRTSIFLKNAW